MLTKVCRNVSRTNRGFICLAVLFGVSTIADAQKINGVNSAKTSGGSLALEVNGSGFDTTSQVRWNGTALTTNYQSAKLIVGVVPPDVASSGTPALITVVNTAGGVAGMPSAPYTYNGLPEGVDLLLGIGTAFRGPISDYTITNNLMTSKNLGYVIPEALVGISVPVLPTSTHRALRNLAAFASAQFSSSTSNDVTSFTLGIGFHMNKYMHFLMGYSLQPTSQPSPGFRTAAANFVAGICPTPTAPTCVAPYSNFNAAELRNNHLNAFDGFPVPSSTPAPMAGNVAFTYAGAAVETDYKSGAFIGVAFPLSFRSAFEGTQ